MEEVDVLLKRWIPVNTIIREEVREAIVKMKMEAMDRAYKAGYELAQTGQIKRADYKPNTNKAG